MNRLLYSTIRRQNPSKLLRVTGFFLATFQSGSENGIVADGEGDLEVSAFFILLWCCVVKRLIAILAHGVFSRLMPAMSSTL